MSIHNLIRDFYFSPGKDATGRLLQLALSTMTPLYSFARRIHQGYRVFQSVDVETPVVSIGNLSLGGTGKTAFTLWLAEELRTSSTRLGVLKRGEGNREGVLPEDESIDTLARDFGDESALFRYRFPDVPVGVGVDRVALATVFDEEYDLDVILIDDGFQYRRLGRNLDVVLMSPADVENNWQLPAGPLREPLSALGRANMVSLKTSDASTRKKLFRELSPYLRKSTERLSHQYRFRGIYRNGEDRTEHFRENDPFLISTLARPEQLEGFLDEQGITPARHRTLPDHASVVGDDQLEHFPDRVVMTEKEAVKLPDRLRDKVGIIKSDLTIHNGDTLVTAVRNLLSGS